MSREATEFAARRTSWRASPYFGSLLLGVLSVAFLLPTLNPHRQKAMGIAIASVAIFAVGRYLIAWLRRERNRRWIAYCIVWLLMTPEWMVVEKIAEAVWS